MPTTPDGAELERMTRAACDVAELSEHGYYADFVELAAGLVDFYGGERRSLSVAGNTGLEITIDDDVVEIDAHDVVKEDGSTLLWIVQTGHTRKNAEDGVDVRALVVGAMTKLPGAKAQILNLADRRRVTVVAKSGAEGHLNRMASAALAGMRSGAYAKTDKASPRTCGNCPALLICDALPEGPASVTI